MARIWALVALCLSLQACSGLRGDGAEAAMFAALFDVPRGSCRQLRAGLDAEIAAIKAAKKKADEEFLAEQDAPQQESKMPRLGRKQDPLASLRDVAKKTAEAEKFNAALKERRCRTVDIEAALK
jgi:hypothetical protein